MPVLVSRLRRWFAVGAILMVAVIAGMYFYAQWRVRNVVHELPPKLGYNVQQTAEGFSISKSEQGRTVFTVSASKAVQFKEGGKAELHNVKITVFGKDASRFDRISGDDFEFDPASGNVTARGPVLIDLEGNPQGIKQPDQSGPPEMKNPIRIHTSGLVFNRNTGDAATPERLDFETAQAKGWAVGVQYIAKTRTMTLQSSVAIDLLTQHAHLDAQHAVITHDPRVVLLTHPRMVRDVQTSWSDRATLFLREDNTVERILAEGEVESEVKGKTELHSRSDQADLTLAGHQNQLTNAVLIGNVQLASQGAQPATGSAARVTLRFGDKQTLQTALAEGGVQLVQDKVSAGATTGAGAKNSRQGQSQRVEMTAPVMDFTVKDGRLLERADTTGPPKILITQEGSEQKTIVTAGKFTAAFTDQNRLASLHGEPDSRITNSAPGQPDRVSTGDTLDVAFLPAGGISKIVQQGNLQYLDDTRKAWGERGTYTTADQVLVLTGSPRVADTGMTTTAQTIRFLRVTGDAIAEGDVKTTYSDMKAQPEGGMLSSSDPIHVTSRSVTAHRSPAVAVYTGNARLWQVSNVVEAPTLTFDRDHRSLMAQGTAQHPVSTVLVQVDKSGKATPVNIHSARLTYIDADRKVILEGGVTTKSPDSTMTAQKMDVYLVPRDQVKATTSAETQGQVDHIVAQGDVVITQPTRRATGERLDYMAADEKYILTGGPPSIFDAERGKITGDSLTFFRRDDRVLVEGRETSPTVTRTRVAR